MHNESSGFDQFHVRRDRMFHITRWKRPTIASALSVLALSVALTSHAMAAGKTISAVMHADLRTPGMMTTAYIVRDFGYMIFDTLLAQDANFKIQPQMAEWKVSDDKLTYTFTLRDGLKWHDGAPVTAEDCVASLKRWGKADGGSADRQTSSGADRIGSLQIRAGGIPGRRQGGIREEQGLCAAQGAAELDLRRQGGEGRSRRVDHHGGCADRGERAAIRRYRLPGGALVRHSAGAGRQQGHQDRNPEQARLPDSRANEFPSSAI